MEDFDLFVDEELDTGSPFDELELAASLPSDIVNHDANLYALTKFDGSAKSFVETQTAAQEKINFDQSSSVFRSIAAAERRDAELRAVGRMGTSFYGLPQESLSNLSGYTRKLLDQKIEDRQRYALEEEAAERLEALRQIDPDRADLVEGNEEATDVALDILAKKLLVQRVVAEREGDVESRNILEYVVDTALGVVPLRASAIRDENVDLPGVGKEFFDKLFAGRRLGSESDALWKLPMDEFSEYLPTVVDKIKNNTGFFGYRNKAGELNVTRELLDVTPSEFETNFWSALDVAGLIPVGKVTSLVKLAGAKGGRTAAKNGLTAIIEGGAASSDDLASVALPKALTPTGSTLSVGVGLSSARDIELAEQALGQLTKNRISPERLTPEELSVAVESTKKEILSSLPKNAVVDFASTPRKITLADKTSVDTLDFTIGKRNGGGWRNQRDASNAAKRYGIGPEGVFRDPGSGQYFIRSTRGVQETGFFSTDISSEGATNVISRNLMGTRQLLDDLTFSQGVEAQTSAQYITRALGDEMKSVMGRLSGDEAKKISDVQKLGMQQQKYFTRTELTDIYLDKYKRAPLPRELDAYSMYVLSNDISYLVRNAHAFRTRFASGFENVDIRSSGLTVSGNGRVRSVSSAQTLESVYDVGSGTRYNSKNPLTSDKAKELDAKGFSVIELETPHRLPDGTSVRFALAKRADFTRSPLNPVQLAYRPGGNVFYRSGSWFAKQARRKFDGDVQILTAPKAFRNGTKNEMSTWVAEQNKALAYIKANPSVTAADLAKHMEDAQFPFDAEEFLDDVARGNISVDEVFEAVEDRRLPSEYYKAGSTFAFNEDTVFEDVYGYMYYSKRGDMLRNAYGETAEVLDPFESLGKSLENVVGLSSFGDFKFASIERWVNTYGKYLDDAGDRTPSYRFMNAGVRSDVPEEIQQKVQASRDAIKRILGYRPELDRQLDRITVHTAEFVAGKDPGLREKFVSSATNWLREKNPVAFLRGWAFDSKLGFLNPAQFVLGLSTAISSIALQPKYAGAAIGSWPVLRAYSLAPDKDALVKHLVKSKAHKAAGFDDAEEFATFLKSVESSGWLDVGKGHSLIGREGSYVNFGALRTVENAREFGRFFFNEGEIANHAIGFRLAWGEVRDTAPNLKPGTPQFQRQVLLRASDYTFNMQKTGDAAWQRGVLSIPTQFFGYMARSWDALLGRQFTAEQKTRLVVAHTLLYGAGAAPVVGFISDLVQQKTGNAPDPSDPFGFIDRGVLDSLLFWASGGDLDVKVGERLSIYGSVNNVLKELFGVSEFSTQSVPEFIGGATAGIWGDILLDAGTVLEYQFAESGSGKNALTREALIDLSKNISTVSNGLKALSIMRYGTYMTNSGGTLAADIPSINAYSVMLTGSQLGVSDQISALKAVTSDRKKTVDEAAAVIRNYRTRYLNEPDNRKTIRESIDFFVGSLPYPIARAALRKANETDRSLEESLSERVEKIKLENELGESDNAS